MFAAHYAAVLAYALRRAPRALAEDGAHVSRWAFALDPELGPVAPAGGVFAIAVAVIAVAARAF